MGLPTNKKLELANIVADDVKKLLERHYADLRRHEVNRDDAVHIVRIGRMMVRGNPDLGEED